MDDIVTTWVICLVVLFLVAIYAMKQKRAKRKRQVNSLLSMASILKECKDVDSRADLFQKIGQIAGKDLEKQTEPPTPSKTK